MAWRRQLALTIFLAGVLLPVALRVASGPGDALRSLPLAAIAVAVGAVVWVREGAKR